MKTSHRDESPSIRSGMTLIELTVVILVLLSLIGVLFVGAAAWKRGSDRSAAILLIRNAQMGLRSHLQISGITETSTEDGTYSVAGLQDELFGNQRFVYNGIDSDTGLPKAIGELPDHPKSGLSFDFVADSGDIVPAWGELYICTGGSGGVDDYTYNPNPTSYQHW